MHILQTIPTLNAGAGGPSSCTASLVRSLYAIDHKIKLLTLDSPVPDDPVLGNGEPWLQLVSYDAKTPFLYSPNTVAALRQSEFDLYHSNGIWQHANHATCQIARSKNKPYMITTHGMLFGNALLRKRWRKQLFLTLGVQKDIDKAFCLHATSVAEKAHNRRFGYSGPIAVIPNPIEIPEDVTPLDIKPSKKSIGFLGRLHEIKKIDYLIKAAAIAKKKGAEDFEVLIMGTGSAEYEQLLKEEVKALNLEQVVKFVGFVSGKQKYEMLTQLWGLFVPSESENFGMIVPEALICGTPVYASLGTPWEELNAEACGWWADNSPENISTIILDLLSMSPSEVSVMGLRGRKLIENKYEATIVARQMYSLYEWILGGGQVPEFVYEHNE